MKSNMKKIIIFLKKDIQLSSAVDLDKHRKYLKNITSSLNHIKMNQKYILVTKLISTKAITVNFN